VDTIPGALYLGDQRTRFRVWAPFVSHLELRLLGPADRLVSLPPAGDGYFQAVVPGVEPGALYAYRLDERLERPDPASRRQPKGVHGPSEVVEGAFAWEDSSWSGLPLTDYIIYELHIGTFTPQGTFEAVINHLPILRQLGITALEFMPLAQFPGHRNWGYDGVYPYAVQDSYGGARALKRLVNACHRHGLAVILDVVYNHLGPEGNYLWDFGPYFSDAYRTPWGEAINFDGPDSDPVRQFFIDNALYWITEFHVDALRLDALHAIVDPSARPFLQDLAEAVQARAAQLGRQVFLIAESDRNDPRFIRPLSEGGLGLDAHWNDDFHHALHVLLTNEQQGYYRDFGGLQDLAAAWRDGFVYDGRYSLYRRRRHGASSASLPADRFVAFAQNHDQVGNRARGERLGHLVSWEAAKLAAAVVVWSPSIPLLFMGEEYGETAPFLYFTSHGDPDLIAAVRRGRRQEFLHWEEDPPDPQAPETFQQSQLHQELRREGRHAILQAYYQEALRWRREVPALAQLRKEDMVVQILEPAATLFVHRWCPGSEAVTLFNFESATQEVAVPLPAGTWMVLMHSAATRWSGPGDNLPGPLVSSGECVINLPSLCAILLQRRLDI